MKKLLCLFGLTFLLASCGSSLETNSIDETDEAESEKQDNEESLDLGNPIVRIALSNGKSITCELYKDIAPKTVQNFLTLVDNGFYTNTIFHRVIPDFMVQGGGFYIEDNTIYQKSSPTVEGEFSANGYTNTLSHTLVFYLWLEQMNTIVVLLNFSFVLLIVPI